MSYWEECISESFDEIGISATKEQIATMAGNVEISAENYGMAHGHEAIPNPLLEENNQLKKQLKDEQDKIECNQCGGRGTITSSGGSFTATSQCWKCLGEGRHLP